MKDRKHLTWQEVEKLIKAAECNRYASRDRCLLLLMFRHGLRVSEACGLKLSQVDIESRGLHVQTLQKGLSTTQATRTDELKAIRAYMETRKGEYPGGFFFCSERGKVLSRKSVWDMINKCGERAALPFAAHPHMLRHACGFALADQGAD